MGASSALNVAAAEMMAKELGSGHTIVTILCGISFLSLMAYNRWSISIPDASFQQEVVGEQGIEECNPRPSAEIRRFGLTQIGIS